MKVVKYRISEFLGNHKALIYQNNVTIYRKALSGFPVLSNVGWGEMLYFGKPGLDSFN